MSIKLCAEADSFRTEEKDFAYSVKMAQELGFNGNFGNYCHLALIMINFI